VPSVTPGQPGSARLSQVAVDRFARPVDPPDLRTTAAGVRAVSLEPELVQVLREHKIGSRWSQRDDLVFPGGSVTERANQALAEQGKPPIPAGVTFHSLRRTYAALRAELGEHPAITAAQMGHRDPRMTLRVYTDVTGVKPQTRMGGLLDEVEWAPMGTGAAEAAAEPGEAAGGELPRTPAAAGDPGSGSDGTRTRGLRRDRPAL